MKISITDIPKEINIKDQKMSLEEVLHTINTTSAHKDSKLILFRETEEEYLAKFNWISKNKWKVDYPIRLQEIHKQRYLSLKQCLQVIEIFYSSNDVYNLKGFYDVPINHFTLDEMIEFKKEDEMMLRGQDPDQNSNTVTNKRGSKPKEITKVKSRSVVSTKSTSSSNEKELMSKSEPTKSIPDPIKRSSKTNTSKPKDDNSFFTI